MTCLTNDMVDQWDESHDRPITYQTNDMVDQWHVRPMTWWTNDMSDQRQVTSALLVLSYRFISNNKNVSTISEYKMNNTDFVIQRQSCWQRRNELWNNLFQCERKESVNKTCTARVYWHILRFGQFYAWDLLFKLYC